MSEEKIAQFLTSDDPALRKMGLSLSSGIDIPKSCNADLFALAFFDPEPSNRKTAFGLISKLFPKIIDILKKEWRNSPPNTRNESKVFEPYQILYDWDAETFMNTIKVESKNKSFDSRQIAIKSYKILRGKERSIPESYEGLIGGFVKFLGKEKYKPAKDILIEIYKIYGDNGPGSEVLAVASTFGGKDMEDVLILSLMRKNYFVSNSIDRGAIQLVKMGTKRITKKLIEELSTSKHKLLYSNPRIRDVFWTLGKMGHSEALEPLINLCRTDLIHSKDSWEALSASAFSVAELSENNKDIALEYLYDLLDNTSEWVVESGVYALGIIGDKRSIPYLETVIEGKRGKGHSGAFGWSRYIPLTKKTAKNVLEYITKEKKIPSVKSPWPPHHDWSRNEIWMD